MLKSETLVAGRPSNATAVAAVGVFQDPDGLINGSETLSTSWGSLSSAAAGTPAGTTSQKFDCSVGPQADGLIGGRILLRIPWQLVTQAADPAVRATLQAQLTVDGTPVGSPVSGLARNMNSANGTKFVELFGIDIGGGTPIAFTPGMKLGVQINPTVTTPIAGTTFTAALLHNPGQAADQLVLEFQGAAGVI